MRIALGLVAVVIAVALYAVSSPKAVTDTRDGYLVLAVSWTPSWCAAEGDARGDDRCDRGAGTGWLVHGLWPQNDDGTWPEFCDSPHAAPSRNLTRGMEDIMGSAGLAAYQWRKHGSCSGLSPEAYFQATRAAFAAIRLPAAEALSRAGQDTRLRPDALLDRLRRDNPAIEADMAIATCQGGMLREVRVCLSHDLTPVRCDDVVLGRECRADTTRLPAIR
jgi:ribonuclease T2